MTDYINEERATDGMTDAWSEELPSMTVTEIMDAIRRVSASIEAMYVELDRRGHIGATRGADYTGHFGVNLSDDAQSIQSDLSGATAQAA